MDFYCKNYNDDGFMSHEEKCKQQCDTCKDATTVETCPICCEEKEINGVSGYCDDCRPKNR